MCAFKHKATMERKSTWRDLVGGNPTILALGSSRKPHRVEPLERGAFQSSVEEAESGDIDPRSHCRPLSRQHAAGGYLPAI